MHCVDLGESFPTHIFLQNLASIQPKTSPFKFARSPRTDPPGLIPFHVKTTGDDCEDGCSVYADIYNRVQHVKDLLLKEYEPLKGCHSCLVDQGGLRGRQAKL